MDKEYGIIKPSRSIFPVRNLLVVPYEKDNLTLGFPAFGPATYRKNLEEIRKTYFHPETLEEITFRPATTSESVWAAAYGFGSKEEVDAKRDIFDKRWIQLGYIVEIPEGIFTNTTITDESILKLLLKKTKKVNGIYLIDKTYAFAPRGTFEPGIQDYETFIMNPRTNGLARALEHTSESVPPNFKKIAEFYKGGVDVGGFGGTKEPVLKVAGLDSDEGISGGRLDVYGGCDKDLKNYGGFSFGVLNNKR